VTDSLSRYLLSGFLFAVALIIAVYLFMMFAATAGYSTYSERALYLGFIGIILALLFIGFRIDSPAESTSSRQPQSDIR